MRILYNLLFYLLLPFILLRLTWRSRQFPVYRQRWRERFGYITPRVQKPLWIHAVSFGEAQLAVALVKALQQQQPHLQFMLTTMTATGAQALAKIESSTIQSAFVPYDLPGTVRRFLHTIKPQLLINMETELWPNILTQCECQHIPVAIANARLSPRSVRGYHKIRRLLQPILQPLHILAQTATDAQNFIALGANPAQVHICGNLKFDLTPPIALCTLGTSWRQLLGNRPTLIAASTHPDEEIQVLAAFHLIRQQIPNTLLILVPRHPERFTDVAALCQQQHYQVLRRSCITADSACDILLGDSMGELWAYYAAADVAFVGGSLVPQGGHNLLEPAALGLPVLAGPHLHNFSQITAFLQTAGALEIVADATALANTCLAYLQNPALRHAQGQRAQQVVQENQGALARYCAHILQLIS